MNRPPDPNPEAGPGLGDLPLDQARAVDAACDRFEADRAAGLRPRPEDCLGGVAPEARPALLRELRALAEELGRAEAETPGTPDPGRPPDTSRDVDPEAVVADAGPAPGPTSGRRFRILRPHAAGGLGQVSVAIDRELNREVALKEIRTARADDPGTRARFVLEAEVTGALEHPGVVPIYSLGRYAGGRPFYAMRLVRGESLARAIRDHFAGPARSGDPGARELAMRQLLRRFLDLCNTVAYAHSRGVLHRDIKPDNVLVGPFGETLLVDWGLARVVGRPDPAPEGGPAGPRPASHETQPDSVVGTPGYMSPEQAAGRRDLVGPASDVFSLGATLYQVLVGRPPTAGAGPDGVPAPRRVDPSVAPALEAVCLKAMAADPPARYGSAAELAAEVERWLAGEPVSAYPEPLPARARRWLRRHRTPAGSAAAAAAVAAVALAALAASERAGARRVAAERDRADARFRLAAEAVDGFRAAVAGADELRYRDDLGPLRRDLLAQPMAYFRRLAGDLEAEPEPGPGSRAMLADAYKRLGDLQREVGPVDDALASYRAALEARERLARDDPGDDDRLNALAGARHDLGTLLGASGRPGEAERALRAALAARAPLASRHPDRPAYRLALARTRGNLANLLERLGRDDEALDLHREALADYERAGRAAPGHPEARSGLATERLNLANLLESLAAGAGDPGDAGRLRDESLGLYRAAADAFGGLLAERPDAIDAAQGLGRTRNNLGWLLRVMGRPDEALAAISDALAVKERLARDYPAVAAFRADLARTLVNLGGLLGDEGRAAEAADACRRALEVFDALALRDPGVDRYRGERAEALAALGSALHASGDAEAAAGALGLAVEAGLARLADRPDSAPARAALADAYLKRAAAFRDLGRAAEAARDARDRLALDPDGLDPIGLYNAACDLALCVSLADSESEARAYADEALACLRRALAAGFDRPESLDHLRLDATLRPLHAEPGFRAALAGLMPPDDPFLFDLGFPDDPFAP